MFSPSARRVPASRLLRATCGSVAKFASVRGLRGRDKRVCGTEERRGHAGPRSPTTSSASFVTRSIQGITRTAQPFRSRSFTAISASSTRTTQTPAPQSRNVRSLCSRSNQQLKSVVDGRHAEIRLPRNFERTHLQNHGERFDSRKSPERTAAALPCLMITTRWSPMSRPAPASPHRPHEQASAGCALYQRKPSDAPTSAPQKTVSSPMRGHVHEFRDSWANANCCSHRVSTVSAPAANH